MCDGAREWGGMGVEESQMQNKNKGRKKLKISGQQYV